MRVISLLLLALMAGSLQGCFPVVAVGVGAGVLMAQDRRTSGTYVEDQSIELKALERVGREYKDNVHYGVTSFNRAVLVTGQAPNDAVKSQIGKIVSGIENVRVVHNEMTISAPSSLTTRASDSLITSNVKLRFVNEKKLNADRIKVVTENGVVFLMGIVTRAEADVATELTRTTSGVQRVIKMFEYQD